MKEWRDKSRLDAQKLIEQKSRSLKPWGNLPGVVDLQVAVLPDSAVQFEDGQGLLRRVWDGPRHEKQKVLTSIENALKGGRRFLLLGDLGSGKSTLAARFIESFLEENAGFLGFLIPANAFDSSSVLTVEECLSLSSVYINQNVVPTAPTVDLKSLLSDGVEVALAVDGLDEIDVAAGGRVLRALERIVSLWPNIKVLVTARPAEIHGVDLGTWRVITTVPVNDNDLIQLFRHEALARGLNQEQSDEHALLAIERLKRSPQLVALASTPLAARLLYPRLTQAATGENYTLGDLLVELARERLGGWNTKDSKESVAPNFEREVPNEDSRAQVLGIVALGAIGSRRISIESFRYQLSSHLNAKGVPRANSLVEEALIFYSRAGLISLGSGSTVEFPSQPMLEVIAGFGLAHTIAEGRTTFAAAKQELWRVVSFASTVLRRIGVLERVVEDIGGYIQQLQKLAGGVAAASYIVDESNSSKLAEYYVEGLRGLPPRPLTLFNDELRQSAQSVARALSLAGNTGFEWLYAEYLDPRYPLINNGSQTIQMVFEHWAYLVAGRLTLDEQGKLARMVVPLSASPTIGTHNFLAVLAILVPEAFENVRRLWYVSKWLDGSMFSRWVLDELKNAFLAGNREQVNNVLLGRMREGYESSFACARLWCELNPESVPPREVVVTAIRARAAYRRESYHEKLVRFCQERLGNSVWWGLVRWYTVEGNDRLAAGGALLLYEHGERELELLGGILLRALHDGGYVKEAEAVLGQLVLQNTEKGGRWLGASIAEADYDGAHSGWWRIFLKTLPLLGRDGIPLLRQAVAGVKDMLLPRYPEVRQAFHDLLLGAAGHEYMDMMRLCLDDLEPEIRLGAARILVAIDPTSNPKALETVIAAKPLNRFGNQWEWDEYCLDLPFSPAVLGYIKSRLTSFVRESRAYALAILYRNNFAISAEEREQLIVGMVGSPSYYLHVSAPRRNIFADPASIAVLEKLLSAGNGESPQVAASLLLRFHSGTVSPEVAARCAVLMLAKRMWPFDGVIQQARRLLEDKAYNELVRKTSQALMEQGGDTPLLEILRLALAGNAGAWKDLVWGLVCAMGSTSVDAEGPGEWLLTHAGLLPGGKETALRLSEAARELLSDQRLADQRQLERRQWLALLAHEFVGLPDAEIEAVLLAGQAIMGGAASGLIARLGLVPKGFRARERSSPPGLVLVDQVEGERNSNVEAHALLQQYARESDTIHPNTCGAIERALYGPHISGELIDELARHGTIGTLIANAISFCRGEEPKLEYLARILYSRNMFVGDNSAGCLYLLQRMFRRSVRTYVERSEDFRRRTVDLLKRALSRQDQNVDSCSAAVSLYRLAKEFDVALMGSALEAYATDRWRELEDFAEILVDIPRLNLPETESQQVVAVLGRSIKVLDAYAWRRDYAEEGPVLACLLYPVLYWILKGPNSAESANVFWRGLVMGLWNRPSGRRVEGSKILAAVSPMLRLVPKVQLRNALEMGRNHHDPRARTLAVLFQLPADHDARS